MPNDRLWIHWLTLGIAGGTTVVVGLFTPEIGTLRLVLPLFGAVLLTISIAGALDIGGGKAGGGGGVEREGREARAERAERGREERKEREERAGRDEEETESEKLRRVGQEARTEGPPEGAGS